MHKLTQLFFIIFLLAGMSFAQNYCPDGIVSYWKMDDESGASVEDYFGNNDGFSSGSKIPSSKEGIVNGALYFDGDDGVTFPSDESFDIYNAFSVEVWVKTLENAPTQVFFGRHTASKQTSWWIGFTGGKPQFSVRDNDSDSKMITAEKMINDNQWHHLVGVHDPATNYLLLYVDGKVEELKYELSIGEMISGSPITMGFYAGENYFYTGYMDEAALYNKIVPVEEVKAHYRKGLAGLGYCDEFPSGDKDFVLIADQNLNIYSHRYGEGNIHSNGNLMLGRTSSRNVGYHKGNFSAIKNIRVYSGNKIDGDLTAKKVGVSSHAKVTGTITEKSNVDNIKLKEFEFNAGGHNVNINYFREESLKPGSYNKLRLKYRATLNLVSGDYYFNSFDTDLSSKIKIDVSSGPVNIYVVRKLDISYNVDVEISGDGTDNSKMVNFYTLHKGVVRVNHFAKFYGSLYAPNAHVVLGTSAKFKGSLEARKITVYPWAQFVSHSSELNLRKAEGEEEFNEADYMDLENDEEILAVINKFELEQNYPNPFNPSTTIRYALPEASTVKISVYNVMGEKVSDLVDAFEDEGYHEVNFNAANLASGIYIYRIEAGSFTATKKMQLLK